MCDLLGGSSASTDRKYTLDAFGSLGNVISSLSNTGANLTSSGATDTGAASKYYRNILSGDPNAVMSAAAPEVNAIKRQATQQTKSIANLGGNRTGGTNAASQDIASTARGQIADTIAKQRSGAAAGEAKIGAGETGAGITATSNAGTAASDLADASIKSRSQSQAIHDAAVDQWTTVAADLLFG